MSLTPFLLLAELAFLFALFRNANKNSLSPSGRLLCFWAWIAAYSVLVSYLGYRQVFVSDAILEYLPALWLQVITVVVCVAPALVSTAVRNDLRLAVDGTTRTAFIYFHMLRFAALGTMLGAAKGTFPLYFELLVGVPDLLFAASALFVLRREKTGRLSKKQFLVWNLLGAFAIIPAAPIVLQLGLPGPCQLFTSQPDSRVVFTFPMAIAPMIGVPLFVLVNLLVVWRLLESRTEQSIGKSPPPGWKGVQSDQTQSMTF